MSGFLAPASTAKHGLMGMRPDLCFCKGLGRIGERPERNLLADLPVVEVRPDLLLGVVTARVILSGNTIYET